MNRYIYPHIREWLVPEGIFTSTLAGVRPSGERGRESGAFWLGYRAARTKIEAVVLPSGPGVEEYAYQWRVSPEVFGEVARWAKPHGLTLIGVAHTHIRGVPVDLSWADRTQSVQVPGMLAVVIGNGGQDAVFTDWGWFVYERNDYRRISHSELINRVRVITDIPHTDVFRADSTGVRPIPRIESRYGP
jgi:hypothetical protein